MHSTSFVSRTPSVTRPLAHAGSPGVHSEHGDARGEEQTYGLRGVTSGPRVAVEIDNARQRVIAPHIGLVVTAPSVSPSAPARSMSRRI